jgi:outer membrane protein
MRKTLLITMASLALTATAAMAQAPTSPAAPAQTAAAPTSSRIGYINSQRVMTEAPGALEARTTIEKETNKHRADLALADDSIKNLIADFQKKQLALSKDARDKQEADIRARQQSLQDRADALEQQMQKREQELIKPIMDRINAVLADMRKEGNYLMIFDVSSGSVVAADPAADLTEQVVARLKVPATATATVPKK